MSIWKILYEQIPAYLAEQDRKAIDELLRAHGYDPTKLVATPQGAR